MNEGETVADLSDTSVTPVGRDPDVVPVPAPGATPRDRLEVLTTDPASVRDFGQFSRFVGHPILEQEEAEGVFTFLFECAPR